MHGSVGPRCATLLCTAQHGSLGRLPSQPRIIVIDERAFNRRIVPHARHQMQEAEDKGAQPHCRQPLLEAWEILQQYLRSECAQY